MPDRASRVKLVGLATYEGAMGWQVGKRRKRLPYKLESMRNNFIVTDTRVVIEEVASFSAHVVDVVIVPCRAKLGGHRFTLGGGLVMGASYCRDAWHSAFVELRTILIYAAF